MRYFYVTYSAEGATGACTFSTNNFINHERFKKEMLTNYPHLENVFILSWVEMTKEDYLVFIKERQ